MKKVVFFVIVVVALFRSPDISVIINRFYRNNLFNSFHSQIINDDFNAEDYWQFRERFSNGSFTADQTNTNFLGTFKITNVSDQLTTLLFYNSKHLDSIDGLLKGNFSLISEKIKQDFQGEILVETDKLVYIQIDDRNYILAFIEPIDTMKKVNGMFDYKPDEYELIKDCSWYNITRIQL
ncbi:MAG: hypothetical protein CO028_04090 [Candidatus Levybacteria bacterium CG_4_9_14_0_2_um_filter_35_21]|nr:MAG: hypothetical protein COW87_02680 [Candidatus Levybacteria bacterium CG22_combo_CG10-13_8_21_14_all_35_11]PJC54117.1 MAG: hypothetical protein CO028_04090 [Candidatus Levybacteria bacterium CG_4_9_14_0_2_um_filter_35_21]